MMFYSCRYTLTQPAVKNPNFDEDFDEIRLMQRFVRMSMKLQ